MINPTLSASPVAVTIVVADTNAPQLSRSKEAILASKIMIVDDEPLNIKISQRYLTLKGYSRFVTTTDPREAMAMVYHEEPDMLLLDVMMPFVSGLDLLDAVRADKQFCDVPVVILTASNDPETKRQALEKGATDFLNKPVDPSELIPRIHNVLMLKQHQDHLQRYSRELESEVLQRTAELAKSRQEVIHCLARAAEFRDDDTGRHVYRVGRYARLIAAAMGWEGDRLHMLEQAAQLHDIGKIGIPDSILLKPGKLTPDELEVMQKHSAFGQRITQTLPEHELNLLRDHTKLGSRLLETSDSPILAMAAVVSLSHHEKWDGTGYPLGLAGENIPIEGRITAVADVFDALSSKRPHKPRLPLDECFQILADGRGKHFDPVVLDAFLRCREEVVRIQRQFAEVE